MEKYGFVYIWRDRKHKRYYIGSHWGTENDGYICSSSWMKRAYKRRPTDFKRRIFSKHDDRKELLMEENRILKMIKLDELSKKYYNVHNHDFGHWSNDEFKRALVVKKIINKEGRNEKISRTLKGRKPSAASIAASKLYKPSAASIAASKLYHTGKKLSTETKEKISQSMSQYAQNRTETHKENIAKANQKRGRNKNFTMAGRKHSEASREKMREARLAFLEKQKS